jgi:O-acetyl-ADP-ribose deacetylase (regulator of RNase III)
VAVTETRVGGVTLQLAQGDITNQPDLDAVTNAANAELRPGGGVAGAIHAAAGPELDVACRPLAPIAPGECVLTPAFDLPNRAVLHCLGPVYGRDEPSDLLLASCYRSALWLADSEGLASVGFPALSTGIFGYPLRPAAEVALSTVLEVAEAGLDRVQLVRFVLFSADDLRVHTEVLAELASDGPTAG